MQDASLRNSSRSFGDGVKEESNITKIQFKFTLNEGVVLTAKIIKYGIEHFSLFQFQGPSESTYLQINAAKAEYVTMMINSLSHEILTPLAEIFKHCQSFRLKSAIMSAKQNSSKVAPSLQHLNLIAASPTLQKRASQSASRHGGSRLEKDLKMLQRKDDRSMKNVSQDRGGGSASHLPVYSLAEPNTQRSSKIYLGTAYKQGDLSSLFENQRTVSISKEEQTTAFDVSHLKNWDNPGKTGECGLLGPQRRSKKLLSAYMLLDSGEPQQYQGGVMAQKKTPRLSMVESESIQSIQRVANRIQIFVDGLMAYSQILSNRFEMSEFQRFSLVDFLKEVLDIFEERRAYKNIQIQICCEESLEIASDKKRLACLFLNFLDNSLKFTNFGGNIRIEVTQLAGIKNPYHEERLATQPDSDSGRSKPGCDVIFFKIVDNGIGINKRDMEIIKYTLSNPFHGSPTSSSAGLGIGLRISQAIISQLSRGVGALQIDSEIGKGSTFSFYLPLDGNINKETIKSITMSEIGRAHENAESKRGPPEALIKSHYSSLKARKPKSTEQDPKFLTLQKARMDITGSQVEIHKTSELRSWNSMELEKHETSQLGSEKEEIGR